MHQTSHQTLRLCRDASFKISHLRSRLCSKQWSGGIVTPAGKPCGDSPRCTRLCASTSVTASEKATVATALEKQAPKQQTVDFSTLMASVQELKQQFVPAKVEQVSIWSTCQ